MGCGNSDKAEEGPIEPKELDKKKYSKKIQRIRLIY